MTADALPYLDAFPAPDLARWREAADKVLKGADFERKLVSRTADGIRIKPLYPAADTGALPERAQAGRWRVSVRADHPDATLANALALEELEGGANSLTLSFSCAPAARGFGLVADDVAALDAILDGVMLELIELRLDPSPQARLDALLLAALVEKRRLDPSSLSIAFGLDPIGSLASSGGLAVDWPTAAARLAQTIRALKARGFRGPFVGIDMRPYHEAGATEAQELGAALATAVAYLGALEANGLPLAEARDALAFTLVAEVDEFLTVAKLRAARRLWDRVQRACGLEPAPMALHAETAWRSLTRSDPQVNMLRATVATFSAAVGGADSLTVLPHTAALGLPDAFARRVARNTQLVLMEEAQLWRVADPAAGAGGFEALTDALCEQGWQKFQDLEREQSGSHSGFLAALLNGHIAGGLARVRAERDKAVATRRLPLTGTSEFANLAEAPTAVLPVEPSAPQRMTGVDEPPKPNDLLAAFAAGGRRQLGIAARRTGALSVEALPSRRAAEGFEALREAADAGARRLGRRPTVLLVQIGSAASATARLGFARNLFAAGGIASVEAEASADLAAALKAAGTKLACLCGSDEAYAEEAEAAARDLAAAGATVWLAGRPGEMEAALRTGGVSRFIQASGDALEALRDAHDVLLAS